MDRMASAPSASASLLNSMAWAVEFEPVTGDADRDADEYTLFCRTQRRRFTGCSAHDQCGGTLLDLPIAEVLECGTVDVSIIVEWGRYRGCIAR
jgi:hypothetical protein